MWALPSGGDELKILVVGGGAREHAICAAVVRGGGELYSVMKNLNPGIARMSTAYNLMDEMDVPRVLEWAREQGVEMLVVGPEASLQVGIVDAFTEAGIPSASPTKAAARIETDKAFARDLMLKHDVPGRVEHHTFTDVAEMESFVRSYPGRLVVKPIGLTGGKGVRIEGEQMANKDEVVAYAKEVIEEGIGGSTAVVIEECVEGEEFTLQCFTDGVTIKAMPPVQDHKRAYEGDVGPNTGGMGSYSAADHLLPFLPGQVLDQAKVICQAIVDALRREGCPYVGALYGQFMYTPRGPVVIEVNARFGDPEAMNVLPLLKTNYVDVLRAMINGTLADLPLEFSPKATVCKYIVPKGYGVSSLANVPLGVNEDVVSGSGAILFYASVNEREGQIYTTSSRSVAFVGCGPTIAEAEAKAESALSSVSGEYDARHDIGKPETIERKIDHMRQVLSSREMD
jgi:phosphoribosylamine--glycine ligase